MLISFFIVVETSVQRETYSISAKKILKLLFLISDLSEEPSTSVSVIDQSLLGPISHSPMKGGPGSAHYPPLIRKPNRKYFPSPH